MFHNWLEVQIFALDRQKELLRVAKDARATASVRAAREPEVIPELKRVETGYAQWRRAG